jgi:hypothetical protein
MSITVNGHPIPCGHFNFELPEVMYYLYLPVVMDDSPVKLPPNVEICRDLINQAIIFGERHRPGRSYRYAYLSARKGWASPDNPLNRPGWHCDGFGSNDMNFVWWAGPGTRFTYQRLTDISDDHLISMRQFEEQIRPEFVYTPTEKNLYGISPLCVHATPLIAAPGCMRQYVKVSLSNERYNLENNSHNYLFDYDWPLHSREETRNDPAATGRDYA